MTEYSTDAIREMLCFDASTGRITWKKSISRVKCGAEAGHLRPDGFLRVRISGRNFFAHRIAWLLHHGEWPDGLIDHIDRDRSDNRISNLRIATVRENQMNSKIRVDNSTGRKGVSKKAAGAAYVAQIRINSRRVYLGSFPTPEKAHAAYVSAAGKYFGEFARVM